ncbi:MAG: hypothetical protein M1823_005879 [Watsoniomyces obsoletus]|nr:MAG: hypothetical protein M1823_005879 [Watsoniomyces obsoletus]
MARLFDAEEVRQHNTLASCWVVLYGDVYDVTDYLLHHPGGPRAILEVAGRDGTAEFDRIHSSGTLERTLKPEARIGKINPNSVVQASLNTSNDDEEAAERARAAPLDHLLNLDDIERRASQIVSKKAWAYYFSAADDLVSKRLNQEAYRAVLLRPRIFVDCERCDCSTTLLGNRVGLPVYVAPAAMARLAHPAGEAGIAQASSKYGAMQLISNNASMTPEQIVQNAAPGQVFGWQLYVQVDRRKSEEMLARINRLSDKIKLVCLTLDAAAPGKREHDERSHHVAAQLPITAAVKAGSSSGSIERMASTTSTSSWGGLGRHLFAGTSPTLTWTNTLPWLTQHTPLPIVLKGISTHEDAYRASLHAPTVRAIVLSNHGGRSLDTAPPPMHTLLEIRKYCPEVFDRVEVWIDGGIRRGTDVVKALCLGARGVGIGRAALWGLGAAGPAGVERTLEILQAEIETTMRLLGAQTVAELGPQHVNTRVLEQQIYDGPPGLDEIDHAFCPKPKL